MSYRGEALKHIIIKSLKSISVLCFLAIVLLQYQNCSKANFVASESQTIMNQNELGIKVFPIEQQTQTSQQPLKVLLVIDNSGSMATTQDKLKSNINKLVSKLKNLNTTIRIVKTDELVSGRYSKSTQVQQSAGVVQITKVMPQLESSFPQFKFYSNQTATDKAAVLRALETAITNVGISGSGEEAPIASFTYSMFVDQYFLQGDIPLIYFITDENDSFTMEHLARFPLQQNDLVTALKPAVDITFFNPYTYTYLKNNVSVMPINLSLSRCESSRSLVTSLTGCESFNRPYTFTKMDPVGITCASYVAGGQLTAAEQALMSCRSNPQYNLTSATYKSDIIFDLYADATNKIAESAFFSKLRSYMELKFGARYLFAVSANLAGQSCAKTSSQSFDETFHLMKSYFPEDKVILSSICSDSDYSTLIDKMVTSVTKVMTQSYQLNLKPEEIISQVTLVARNGERLVLTQDQYLRSGNQIEFKNVDLSSFVSGTMEIKLVKNNYTNQEQVR